MITIYNDNSNNNIIVIRHSYDPAISPFIESVKLCEIPKSANFTPPSRVANILAAFTSL
jgi:hypothetical protein